MQIETVAVLLVAASFLGGLIAGVLLNIYFGFGEQSDFDPLAEAKKETLRSRAEAAEYLKRHLDLLEALALRPLTPAPAPPTVDPEDP